MFDRCAAFVAAGMTMNSWIKTNKQHLAHSHTFQSHPLNITSSWIIVDFFPYIFWSVCFEFVSFLRDWWRLSHSYAFIKSYIIQHIVNMLWLHFMKHEQLLIKMHHDVSTSNEMIEWNKSMYRNIEHVDDKVVKIHTNILSIFKLRHWRNTSFHWKCIEKFYEFLLNYYLHKSFKMTKTKKHRLARNRIYRLSHY